MAPQLRRLALPLAAPLFEAVADFNCLGEKHSDDPVAANVNGFLADGRFIAGLRHGVSATYLWVDPETEPQVVGYATLTFDSVRLTNMEKQRMEGIGFSDFGALRIQMIGIDHRHQGSGHGSELLRSVTGLARKLSKDVAVRFLLADANVRKVAWYENAGFVRNQAKRYESRPDPDRSISMRLDLLESLRGDGVEGPAAAEALQG
ncbi:MAG TPA: GNAT family N-acetyltransferase [Solirubrobacterales bacterium]|nr:GNAT family N-acetyltransferase [Solirubrobacterales bacterium]